MALLTPDAFEDADEMQRQLGHANEEVGVRIAAALFVELNCVWMTRNVHMPHDVLWRL